MSEKDGAMNDDVTISFSAKELLEKMDGKLDSLSDKFDGLSGRVGVLEQDKANKVKVRRLWHDAVILAATVVMATGSAVGIVAAVHGL